MTTWDDIVATAILGTERRPLAPSQHAGPLGDVIERLDQADREGALLGAAAATALYQRAGQLPSNRPGPGPGVSDPDDLPACPRQAASHLAAMIQGTQRALLPEWLDALAATGRRVPPTLLPDLLELGRAQANLRTAILPVLGSRGRWLAAQNPDWSYARTEAKGLRTEAKGPSVDAENSVLSPQSSALADEWETGDRVARLTLLHVARSTDPALALALLRSTWASEKADDRSAFLEACAIGLSMSDEPFLESALDDRSKEVRRAAASLLARLPDSRLVQRMVARLEPLLAWSPGTSSRLLGLRPGQPARLDVGLPQTCDAALVRDGVEPKPAQRMGERAWWLRQMIAAVPPATWSRSWRVTPAELIAAARAGEWGEALLAGWADATLASRDQDWAEALLHDDPKRADLIGALEPARQEGLLLDILRSDVTPLHQHPVLALLRQTRHAWSPALTRAVLAAVRRHMRAWRDSYDYQVRGALAEEFALRMPPALFDEIAGGWPDAEDVRARWEGVIDRLLITLQFRRDMLEALHRP